MAKLTLFALCALFAITLAQNGRYRPFRPSVTVVNEGRYTGGNDGRYRPVNDGRYQPDNSGQYRAADGKYYPDSSGQYQHDGAGAYSGQNGQYQPDGAGAYSGQNEKYKGDKYGSGAGGSGSAGSGSGSKYTGSGSGSGIAPAAGFGKPVTGKQGSAAGKYDNRNYAILRQEGDIAEDGYHYLYETENGIYGEEQGKLANRGTDEEAMRASGYFTYTGPDSVVYTVRYTADENGFVPQGDHLPTPPPIPEAILRALEYQRAQGTL